MARSDAEIAFIEALLRDRAGLELTRWLVEARVEARMLATRSDADAYIARLRSESGAAELAALIEAVRVGDHGADDGRVLPERVGAHGGEQGLGVPRRADGEELALVGDVERVDAEQLAGGGDLAAHGDGRFLQAHAGAALVGDLVERGGEAAARGIAEDVEVGDLRDHVGDEAV